MATLTPPPVTLFLKFYCLFIKPFFCFISYFIVQCFDADGCDRKGIRPVENHSATITKSSLLLNLTNPGVTSENLFINYESSSNNNVSSNSNNNVSSRISSHGHDLQRE